MNTLEKRMIEQLCDLRENHHVVGVKAEFEAEGTRMEEALRLSRYHPLDIYRGGARHRVWLSWYQHYFVWGMTAGIIRQVALQIGLEA